MAVLIINGCFDVFHEGHEKFFRAARNIGHKSAECIWTFGPTQYHRLIVAVNSDQSARRLKSAKWGEKYPIDSLETRMANVRRFADEVVSFDTEDQLHEFIEFNMPCIIVKGPDYAGKVVTGDDVAPVLILDTPEPESVKQMKKKVYSGGVTVRE